MKKFKRIREWMDIPGRFQPGTYNRITDVPGVTVGHCTIIEGNHVRTGVTIIKPHPGDIYHQPIPCAIYKANGFGKLTGSIQVEELGVVESLIGLTNTLSVCQVTQGILNYHVPFMRPGENSINVLVGETNDGHINDIKGFHIKPEHVEKAISNLGPEVQEGCVGAGTGTICYGYKGGIGTSSRIIPGTAIGEKEDYTIGALVQTNFGGNLNIYGTLLQHNELPSVEIKGSCMIILATDAPMDARLLHRLAKRGIVGMTNTGSYLSNGSGDFCIAFSNCRDNIPQDGWHRKTAFTCLDDGQMNPFFEAAAEAVQEAIYNSLTMARDMETADGKIIKAFDIEDFRDKLTLK